MKDAPIPGHETLSNLLHNLRGGKYVIPDFQRDFDWKPWDINELVKSVFRDYYIGNLLLWKGTGETFEALSCEPIYGFTGREDRSHIVLDGQQRLTALYYVFIAPDVPPPNRRNRYLYFLHVDRFMEGDFESAFDYIWTSHGTSLLRDTAEQYKTHMFPLSVVGTPGFALPNWLQGYEAYWANSAGNGLVVDPDTANQYTGLAREFGVFMEQLTQQYHIAHIELDRDISLDKVCDIFTQINSRGVRLDIFDLMNALLRPKGLRLRQELWGKAEPRLAFVESERINIYVLQVMSILLQSYCSPKYLYYLIPGAQRQVRDASGALVKDVLIGDTASFVQHWEEAVAALEEAINLLRSPQEFGAIAHRFLPYSSILPAFAALQAEAGKLHPFQKLTAQRKIRFWYWASVFNNRYSGSVESTSARDYLDVKQWLQDDGAEPGLIADFRQTFRNIAISGEVRRGTSVYNGIFNLLILNGARDWITGNVPQPDQLDDHHIVPKSHGSDLALHNPIDTVLNRTPLTSETNRWISDRLPNEYLPELIQNAGESEVLGILESHFISRYAYNILMRTPFTASDYDDFCAERQRTFFEAIESLLIKERLDLLPQIRELDARVEQIELALRDTIERHLNGDPRKLPAHVFQRVNERIQAEIARNPGFEADNQTGLKGLLEYADLRELQDTVSNKGLWGLFENMFGVKELLDQRFQQLASIRNRIRHSRSVDEITRREGEAAIIWFEQIISRAPN